MHLLRPLAVIAILLLSIPMLAQQVTPNAVTPPPGTQDPMAISIVNRALATAGGIAAISAIYDYSGSGNMTYHGTQDVLGTVNVLGLCRRSAVRIDANLSSGKRSWGITKGKWASMDEQGKVSTIGSQASMNSGTLAMPYLDLVIIVKNPPLSVSYKGIVQLDGKPAHEIQVQLASADSNGSSTIVRFTREFFLDASTLLLLQVQELGPKIGRRILRYSDYTMQNGVLVPFSISEEIAGRPTVRLQNF